MSKKRRHRRSRLPPDERPVRMSASDAMAMAESMDMGDGATLAYAGELCGAEDDGVLIDMLGNEGYFHEEARDADE